MYTSLYRTEPLLAPKIMLQAQRDTSVWNSPMLTIEQRMQLDMFLDPFQTWTIETISTDGCWQIHSCFAPRLHRNGEIDFVAPYAAGSLAMALITAHPLVTILVGDMDAERRLEGFARAVVLQRSWERNELLAHLQWRTPGATDRLGSAVEVVLFYPIYLRYYDRRRAGSTFEVRWHSRNQAG